MQNDLICKLGNVLPATIIKGSDMVIFMLGSTTGRHLHLLLVSDRRRIIKSLLKCTCEKCLRGHEIEEAGLEVVRRD